MLVLVIPDVHLKPDMFRQAEDLLGELRRLEADRPPEVRRKVTAVSLGDLADDWEQGRNLRLYEKTYDAAILFFRREKEALFCIGNHDISYVWGKMESGYSTAAEPLVNEKMNTLTALLEPEGRCAFIHRIDRVLFSHGGLTSAYVQRYLPGAGDIDGVLWQINHVFGADRLWQDSSPLWARVQGRAVSMYPRGYLQVVGHTPMERAYHDAGQGTLSLDTFSTWPSGQPFGEGRFVVVDTERQAWSYAPGSEDADISD